YRDAAGSLRAEIFLYLRDPRVAWGRGSFGGGSPPPDPQPDRQGSTRQHALGRAHRRIVAAGRRGHRPPHGRKVSRSDAHSVLDATSAGKTARNLKQPMTVLRPTPARREKAGSPQCSA